jgi:hemoglobin
MPVKSMYERLGGMSFFEALTERFYAKVATDEVLRPLYPEDLDGSRQRLCLFLAQFWGGPRTYEELQGSPRLRARHEGFRIGAREHDAWLLHMTAAMKEVGLGALEETQLLSYFKSVASHLVNTRDDAIDLDDGETYPVPGPEHLGPARLPIDKRGA